MKLVIDPKYFGSQERMTAFIDGVIKEIRAIDEEGKKTSREPSRYLADCHNDLLSLLLILEGYRNKLNDLDGDYRRLLEKQTYTSGDDA